MAAVDTGQERRRSGAQRRQYAKTRGARALRATEERGPEEGDLVTFDHRLLYEVGGNGRPVFEVREGESFGPAVRDFLEDQGWFPNVWFESDHGNTHLISLGAARRRHGAPPPRTRGSRRTTTAASAPKYAASRARREREWRAELGRARPRAGEVQERVPFRVGETHAIDVGYSEAAMHLRVAGKTLPVTLISTRMAQVHDARGRPYSFPITHGEAGIYRDGDRFYGYRTHMARPVSVPTFTADDWLAGQARGRVTRRARRAWRR